MTNRVSLAEFRQRAPGLEPGERSAILRQAELILAENYVHLDAKRKLTSFDPVAACQNLRETCASWDRSPAAELLFHDRVLEVFWTLQDRHTAYLLPAPFSTATAFLPLTVDVARDKGGDQAVVSEVLYRAFPHQPDRSFVPGVRLVSWNGIGIDRILGLGLTRQMRNSSRTLLTPRALTVRPLRVMPLPREDWVTIGYLSARGQQREIQLPWQVATSENFASMRRADLALDPRARSVELSSASLGCHWSLADFSGQASVPAGPAPRDVLADDVARTLRAKGGPFGYLAIPTFSTPLVQDYLRRAASIVQTLPQSGLVLDLRGNTGGSIAAAMGLLQMFSSKPLLPILSQFRATETNLAICEAFVDSYSDPNIEQAIPQLRAGVRRGDHFTPLEPLTYPVETVDIGFRYPGKLVVLFDEFSYSAAEIFSAAVTDNSLGSTISSGGPSGGGGANVWHHSVLCDLAGSSRGKLGYERLPRDASFTVAIRRLYRSCAGTSDTIAIEDVGVSPDQEHPPTKMGILRGFPELLRQAATHLATDTDGDAASKQSH